MNSDDSSGAAAPIAGEVEFREELMNLKEARAQDVKIFSAQPIGPTWSARVDRNLDWTVIGSTKKRVDTLPINQRGHYIQLRASDNSVGRSVIEGFAIEHQDEEAMRKKHG